jgi:hypothetical protein
MKATVGINQGKIKATINSIQSKLKETLRDWVEDILSSVYQWTQGLHEECSVKTEKTQLDLEAVMMSLYKQPKSLCKETTHEEGPS